MTDRSILRFSDKVKEDFAFLEDLGFECVSSSETFVRFESSKASINVYHGRRSFEIGLEVAPPQDKAEVYSFGAVLRLIDKEQAERYRNYAARTVQDVAKGVRQLGDFFHSCVSSEFFDDDQLFFRLKVQREEFSKAYSIESQLMQARGKLEEAWKEKNYSRIVEVLSPFEQHLSASERKKLEFSRRKYNE